MNLLPIPNPPESFIRFSELPPFAVGILSHTAAHYASPTYILPWVSYFGELDGELVGFAAFKFPPAQGRVEIAYATFPDREGQGLATLMAMRLIAIARSHDPALTIAAQTLREPNASTRILEKLGFRRTEDVLHPEDGWVWEWLLPPAHTQAPERP